MMPREAPVELRAGLGTLDHGFAVDRVGVVTTALLDLLDEHLVAAATGTVDRQVVQDPPKPSSRR